MLLIARFLSLMVVLCGLARAEDATAILKVRAPVEGAEVYVDGALIGATPLTKYLTPGVHQLRVVADRYDPFVRRVDLAADRTLDLDATLVPGKGTIEFSAGVPGARIWLDGVERGPLPIRLPAPTPGDHAWRVEAPKHEPAEGQIQFESGRNYLVPVELISSAGVVAVSSTPKGATVWLDGVEVGVTPLRLTGVAPGKHGVLVALDGRAAALRNIDTTDGSRGEVAATLPSGGGKLSVRTGHADARVYVDDVLVGQGVEVKLGPIEKGRRKVRVDFGDRAAEDTVSVPGRGAIAVRVSGDDIVERKPLTQQWGFWAAIGGGVAAGGVAAGVVAASNQPDPLPEGDTVVVLP